LVERVGVVLAERVAPDLAGRWSEGPARGLGRAFVVRRKHAEWGAHLVEKTGASQRIVELIHRHHGPSEDDRELALLQAVDEA
jgi:hypothetical protein